MNKLRTLRRVNIGAVEADDIEVLVLNPDAPHELAVPFGGGSHVEDETSHGAQELSLVVHKLVVRTIEVLRVDHGHLGEAEWHPALAALKGGFLDLAKKLMGDDRALLGDERIVLETALEGGAAQEVLILDRHPAQLLVLPETLYIRFDNGGVFREDLYVLSLTGSDPIDSSVKITAGRVGGVCGSRNCAQRQHQKKQNKTALHESDLLFMTMRRRREWWRDSPQTGHRAARE